MVAVAVEFRFKARPGTQRSHISSHHRDNVTAPYGRPKLRSRLQNQEGGPRSLYGHVAGLGGGGGGDKIFSVDTLNPAVVPWGLFDPSPL
jgi:hypothetical protein